MIQIEKIKIIAEWKEALKGEFQKPYFEAIKRAYQEERQRGEIILPRGALIFEAFNRVKPSDLRVLILGQDPYHGIEKVDGVSIPQAMGLSFSVPKPLSPPPSLRNIYKELHRSLGVIPPSHGDLSKWCDQGVMLLNAILSVRYAQAGSHAHWGWETFSDAVIEYISTHLRGVVFMLWGNYAKKKACLIDTHHHRIIQAPHPSPLARGFVGSDVFIQANEALEEMGREAICWGDL